MTEVMVFSWWLGCKFYFKKRVRSLAWEMNRVSNATQESSHNWSIMAFSRLSLSPSNVLWQRSWSKGFWSCCFRQNGFSELAFYHMLPVQLDVAKLLSTEDECNFYFKNLGCCWLWVFRTLMLCTLSVSVRQLQTSSCAKCVIALLHLLRSSAANITEGFWCRNEKIFWLLTQLISTYSAFGMEGRFSLTSKFFQ